MIKKSSTSCQGIQINVIFSLSADRERQVGFKISYFTQIVIR